MGATADGYIDRPHGTLALKGSLIPAYGVNSMISNIPLLGDILASKKGEGIFGVTYSVTGDAEHPTLTDPLSILTPGILRPHFRRPSAHRRQRAFQRAPQHTPGAATDPARAQRPALSRDRASGANMLCSALRI